MHNKYFLKKAMLNSLQIQDQTLVANAIFPLPLTNHRVEMWTEKN